jgi:succinate dehydrogenase/fumarate reductase flavoprotein subunit
LVPDHWDLEYDVVIAGYGYSGGIAAIVAHDDGASAAIFEKMPRFGGNSILSGGSCAVGTEYEPTLQYLLRTCGDATDREILEVFAQGMIEFHGWLDEFAGEVEFGTVIDYRGGTYPFPGTEQLYSIHVTRNERYRGFPWVKGPRAGATLFWVLVEQVKRRPAIQVSLNSPVLELITDASGAVVGAVVEREGERLNVRANRAVILCTGGFEHDLRLREHFLEIQHTIAMSPLGNTGDGMRMGQKVGGAIWHMWHLHGGYGFRIEGLPFALRHPFNGYRDENRKMPWIAIDRYGRRFMNEYPPAVQDTPIRALSYYDPDIQDYPRIPCYLVFDEEGRKVESVARPAINDETITFEWSRDNLAEVEKGYIKRADSIEVLAERLGMEAETLRETVDRWNASVGAGRDRDYHRPRGTMMPLTTPPFYAIDAWPIITNTQGGLVHNARQQVVDSFGKPIPRLYKAGENGSIFGRLYMLSANNTECFIGGRIAGRNAAAEAPWC